MANERLIDELTEARDAFLGAVAGIAPESMTTPGLVGEWSARELIAHLGYWAGRAVETIHAVEQGRTDEIGEDEPPVEEVNATVARVASQTDIATVRRREAASVDVLVERLRALDPSLLDVRLPDGATLEASVREDGSDHYREHADELRGMLDAPPRG
jgi:hypothetical protein